MTGDVSWIVGSGHLWQDIVICSISLVHEYSNGIVDELNKDTIVNFNQAHLRIQHQWVYFCYN